MDRKEEKNNSLYQKAELDISNHSLKEFDLVYYEKNLVIHLNYFDVLTHLYSSRQYLTESGDFCFSKGSDVLQIDSSIRRLRFLLKQQEVMIL